MGPLKRSVQNDTAVGGVCSPGPQWQGNGETSTRRLKKLILGNFGYLQFV